METKQQWVCTKCGGREADTGVIRTTGGGASRYFNIQNHKFEYLSCKRCGYTDLFRPSDQEAAVKHSTFEGVLGWLKMRFKNCRKEDH